LDKNLSLLNRIDFHNYLKLDSEDRTMFLPEKYNILKSNCQLVLNKGLQLSYLLKIA